MAKLVRISSPGSNKLTWDLSEAKKKKKKGIEDDTWNVQTVSIQWGKA